MAFPIGPWPLYESLYNLLNYFHCLLWADLEDNIPRRPVAILMTVVFGSIKIGLIAMIPNIAPALVVGGIMGFAHIPLDIMTVTIMPMLLGLAVDDTIHFINHSQLEYSRTGSYAESTRRVFATVGVAIFLTSTVLILNFSAYLASLARVYGQYGNSLIHHQNATCGVSCGSIPLRRMPNTTPGATAPILRSGCLASGTLLVIRKKVCIPMGCFFMAGLLIPPRHYSFHKNSIILMKYKETLPLIHQQNATRALHLASCWRSRNWRNKMQIK